MKFRNLVQLTRWTAAVLLLSGGIAAFAQPQTENLTPEAAGQIIARELRTQKPPEGEWKGRLKIRNRDRKTVTIPVTGKVTWSGPMWKNEYLTSAIDGKGAEHLTVAHSATGPNEYSYATAPTPGAPLGEEKKLTGAEANIPLAGSDFWLADLGFEFYQWPKQIKRPSEMRRSRACYVLESINPNPGKGGYSRVITWVDIESYKQGQGGIIQAEAYDQNNKLVKEFSLGHFRKIDGQWMLEDMEIRNSNDKTQTKVEYDLQGKKVSEATSK
jgi:Outer membrane lipoprotein-sorting protein